MRTVVTAGITVRPFASSLSSKSTTRYKAHVVSCRYASTGTPMADLVERLTERSVRIKIDVGIVESCKVCDPVLLAPDGCEPPICCAYCQRQSDPEVAYYGPRGFTLCDDCAQEVREEFAAQGEATS